MKTRIEVRTRARSEVCVLGLKCEHELMQCMVPSGMDLSAEVVSWRAMTGCDGAGCAPVSRAQMKSTRIGRIGRIQRIRHGAMCKEGAEPEAQRRAGRSDDSSDR